MPGQNLLGGCIGGVTIYDEDDIPVDCECQNGFVDAGPTFNGVAIPSSISISGSWSNSVNTSPASDVYSFSINHTWTRTDYVEGGTLADDKFWVKKCATCCSDSGPAVFDVQLKRISKAISITNPDSTLNTFVTAQIEITPEYIGFGCAAVTYELEMQWFFQSPDAPPPGPSCTLGAVARAITATGVTAGALAATWDGDPTYDSFTCPVGSNTQSITSSIQVVIS